MFDILIVERLSATLGNISGNKIKIICGEFSYDGGMDHDDRDCIYLAEGG